MSKACNYDSLEFFNAICDSGYDFGLNRSAKKFEPRWGNELKRLHLPPQPRVTSSCVNKAIYMSTSKPSCDISGHTESE
jgi:hypothetical protein